MFEFERVMSKMERIDDLPPWKAASTVSKCLRDPSFLQWVYLPVDANKSADEFKQFSNLLITSKGLEAITEAFDNGLQYDECDRAVATFLYAIADMAAQVYNEQTKALAEKMKENDISRKNVRRYEHKLDAYCTQIERVTACAKKIVKPDVRSLAKDTGLSKGICRLGYWYVPGPKYLTSNRIGIFLKALLTSIYDEIAESGFYVSKKSVRWDRYFSQIFGKKNLANVATLILLEGASSVDKYKESPGRCAIDDCWDSLTEFALTMLDEMPDSIRDQMIELYLKRIDCQIRNKNFDLRVDLTKIPERFRVLRKTVEKYLPKITKVISSAKNAMDNKSKDV